MLYIRVLNVYSENLDLKRKLNLEDDNELIGHL